MSQFLKASNAAQSFVGRASAFDSADCRRANGCDPRGGGSRYPTHCLPHPLWSHAQIFFRRMIFLEVFPVRACTIKGLG